MTRIGRRNPFTRIVGAVKGLLDRGGVATAARRRACVIAHRGAAREAPENTVEAFARAVELGADGIETDVCVTADGVYVRWHDADPDEKVALARQTVVNETNRWELRMADVGSGERRRVCHLTLDELRSRYGYVRKNPDGSDGEPVSIALLHELFDWADGEARLAHVFLDVKLQADQIGPASRLLSLVERRVRRPGR